MMIWRAACRTLSQKLVRAGELDIQNISSLSEVSEILRVDPTLASHSSVGSANYRLFFKAFVLMKREFEQEQPDFHSLISVFEKYSQNGTLPTHTWDAEVLQLLNRLKVIATRKHSDLSTEDFVTLSWRVQRTGIELDTVTLRDLLLRLEIEPPSSAETLVRVMEIFAKQKLHPKDFISRLFLTAFKAVPKTQDQALRLLVCMCQFGEIANNETWRSAIAQIYPLQPLTASELQKINLLRYILILEHTNLLYARINSSATVSSLLAFPQPPQPVERIHQKHSSASALHEEVKHVMSKHPLYAHFKENVNIGNAFIVDFADEKAKVCVDVDSPTHFFRPRLNTTYMTDGHKLLIGFINMKYRALERDGWKVLQVPFYEWQKFLDEQEKAIYMTRKMRRYQPLSLRPFKFFS